jgi:hypothetical protein
MYLPEAFREERPEVLQEFIVRHPLGALICTTADGLTADHVPMMLEPPPSDRPFSPGCKPRDTPAPIAPRSSASPAPDTDPAVG